MKRFFFIVFLLGILIAPLSFVPSAQAQQQLRVASGRIATRGDTKTYRVDVGFLQVLYAVILPTEGSQLDAYLRLYDSADPQAQPIWEDDNSAGGREPYITLPLLPGRYFLEVSGAKSTTGAFTMIYGAIQPWNNSINRPNTYKTHFFHGIAGETIWMQTIRPEDSTLDPYITIEAPDGSQFNVYTNPLGTPDVLLIGTLPQTGRYKVYVSGERGTTGQYSLLIATADAQ